MSTASILNCTLRENLGLTHGLESANLFLKIQYLRGGAQFPTGSKVCEL